MVKVSDPQFAIFAFVRFLKEASHGSSLMLKTVLHKIFDRQKGGSDRAEEPSVSPSIRKPRVLNVGGSNKEIPIPAYFSGWEHVLLDIDPKGRPDLVCDARQLTTLRPAQFDAVYCSHNLEHYYKHDGLTVLRGFMHILRPDGFADIRVPDMDSVMQGIVERGMDIEDILYVSPSGPITARDVIYGWSVEIERSGVDFYAHKTGFTATSLKSVLVRAGFATVFPFVAKDAFELRALAFKAEPTDSQRTLLELG